MNTTSLLTNDEAESLSSLIPYATEAELEFLQIHLEASLKEQTEAYRQSMTAYLHDLQIESSLGSLPFDQYMADFQRRDFVVLAKAFEAVASGQKPTPSRIWWERTKGASKDTDLAAALLWLLVFAKRPVDCQIGAADRDQADEVRKAAKGIIRVNPWLADHLEIQNYNIINRRTESKARIEASDIAGSHGARPDVLILNELSHITKEEFAANMLDNATKVPHGVVCIATNAGFIDSWQWRMRETVRNNERWHFSAFTEPAPWLDPKEIEERRKSISVYRFNRLWKGQWVPQVQEEAEWPAEYFGPDIWFDDWPKDVTIKTIFLDPSTGKSSKHGDYSAFIMLARCSDGKLWCDADLKKHRPVSQIVEDGIELYRQFKPHGFGVETNQFQELIAAEFRRVSRERGMMIPVFGIDNRVNKEVRIRRIGPYLAHKNIRFKANSAGAKLLVQQLVDFPHGDHDDGPDALEGSFRVMLALLNGDAQANSTAAEERVLLA